MFLRPLELVVGFPPYRRDCTGVVDDDSREQGARSGGPRAPCWCRRLAILWEVNAHHGENKRFIVRLARTGSLPTCVGDHDKVARNVSMSTLSSHCT